MIKFDAIIKNAALDSGKIQVVLVLKQNADTAMLLPDLAKLSKADAITATLYEPKLPMNDGNKAAEKDPHLFTSVQSDPEVIEPEAETATDDEKKFPYSACPHCGCHAVEKAVDAGRDIEICGECNHRWLAFAAPVCIGCESKRTVTISDGKDGISFLCYECGKTFHPQDLPSSGDQETVIPSASELVVVDDDVVRKSINLQSDWSEDQKIAAIEANICTIQSIDTEARIAYLLSDGGMKMPWGFEDFDREWKLMPCPMNCGIGGVLFGFQRSSGEVSKYELKGWEGDVVSLSPVDSVTDTQKDLETSWFELKSKPWFYIERTMDETPVGTSENEALQEEDAVQEVQDVDHALGEQDMPTTEAPFGYVVIGLSGSGQEERILTWFADRDSADGRVERLKDLLNNRYAFRAASEGERNRYAKRVMVERGALIDDTEGKRWRVYQVSPVVYIKSLDNPETKTQSLDRDEFLELFPGCELADEEAAKAE